jgi:hypothetical protein
MIDFDAVQEPQEMRTLSVSKIETALLCGLKLKYSYVDKIPRLGAWVLLAGNVFHEIVEFALRERAAKGAYPDWKTLDGMFEPVWNRRVQDAEGKPDFIGWEEKPDDPMEKIKAEYRPLIRVAREEVLPTLQPWMLGNEPVVEQQISMEIQSPVGPFNLLGYIDYLDASGVLMDWKTTQLNEKGELSKRAQRTWLQFAAYSLWAYPIVGEEDLRCEKLFLVRGEKPSVVRKKFVVGRKHREWFIRVAGAVWQMIKLKIFLPNTESWSCNPDFCAFFGGCRGEIPGELDLFKKDSDTELVAASPEDAGFFE